MPAGHPLRLGSRGSQLALAQSRRVARALKRADPGLDVAIVTIETRGDRLRDVPLTAVRDPDFFSAELDAALLNGRVDCCVHSLKDLPGARPAGIRTGAIPTREDPRDVVVFRPEVMERLRAATPLRLGTSSARRAVNVRQFLQEALPTTGDAVPDLEMLPLRGPVEQRLQRVRVAPDHSDALDGVVLALAGLARLWGDRAGHAAVAPLLAGTRLMVLPLAACPTAPGQGALAVECRAGDARTETVLGSLHDADTERRVRGELDLLAGESEEERGGFGATTVWHDSCGILTFVRGAGHSSGRLIWNAPPRPAAARTWDGAQWIRASHDETLPAPAIGEPPAVFLAHWRAFHAGLRLHGRTRLWVSGAASWRRLAREGLWIEGCADNLGFAFIAPTLRSPVLQLPPLAAWTVLTRDDAVASWGDSGVGHVIATYKVTPPTDDQTLRAIREQVAGATHFFWGSAAQFRAVRDWLPEDSHHACGPGKTWRALRETGVGNLQAFPSRQEWRAWVA